jgi:hypothetical protein
MTTPTGGPISIQDIKNEFAAMHGGYNDMNSWGQLVLGRPSGQAVYMSEFYGRSAEVSYGVGIGGPGWDGWYPPQVFGTKYGNVEVAIANTYQNNIQFLFYYSNPTAWNNFIRLHLPDGGIIYKASFADQGNGYFVQYGAAQPPGTCTFVYRG